jgi:hypothetical protein
MKIATKGCLVILAILLGICTAIWIFADDEVNAVGIVEVQSEI